MNRGNWPWKSCLIFALLAFILKAQAAIEFNDAVFPELGTSARALAMGNAFICKTDDSHSVFYNPAGLGTVRYGHIHLTNFHVEINQGLKNMAFKGHVGNDVAENAPKSFDLNGTRELLLDNRGELSHSRVYTYPNVTFRFISFGYLYSVRQRATIMKDNEHPWGDPPFEYAKRVDHGPVGALNLSLWGGVFKIGGSVVYLTRKEQIGEAPKDATFEEVPTEGKAFILTSGARLTLPVALLPTFAIVFHNTGSSKFEDGTSPPPEKIKNSYDVGFSLTPQIGKVSRLHLEFNFKDLSNEYKVSSGRRAIFGIEFDIMRAGFIRFGYGDGFGSAGIGIRSQKLEVDMTTYAVDTTTSKFRGKEDRRFVFSMSLGF